MANSLIRRFQLIISTAPSRLLEWLSRDETQHLLNHSVKIAKFRHLLITLPSILNCIYEKNKLYFGSSHVDGVGCGDGSTGIKGVSHKGDFTRIVGKNLQGTWR
jgi:hypothetical protein